MGAGLLVAIGVAALVVAYLVHDWRSDRRLRRRLADGGAPPRGVAGEYDSTVHAHVNMPRADDGRSGTGF